MEKYLSRKFILACAAFLMSVGTGITGLVINNYDLTLIGTVMCVIAGGIYSASEAYVDGADVKSKQQLTTVTATSGNNVKLVEKVLTGTTTDAQDAKTSA